MDHHSERLTLHPFSAEEAARVADGVPAEGDRWAPDYPVADEVPLLRDLARRLGTGTDPHPFTLYVVVERSTGTAIGGLGFFGPPGPDGAVEIGYGLVPSARGRGYATEAALLAVENALAGGALRIEAGTDPANLTSQRVLLKAGFTEVGRRGDELRFALPLATKAPRTDDEVRHALPQDGERAWQARLPGRAY